MSERPLLTDHAVDRYGHLFVCAFDALAVRYERLQEGERVLGRAEHQEMWAKSREQALRLKDQLRDEAYDYAKTPVGDRP